MVYLSLLFRIWICLWSCGAYIYWMVFSHMLSFRSNLPNKFKCFKNFTQVAMSMHKLINLFFLGGRILILEMHWNQIITSSCAIISFSNSVGSRKMFKIWKSDMFFRCRLLALLFDLHNLEHMIRSQNTWNSNSWTNYSIYQTPILRSIVPFLLVHEILVHIWQTCLNYFRRSFILHLGTMWKVGVDFSNLLLHVGGRDLVHLSTNGHKVLGLHPT